MLILEWESTIKKLSRQYQGNNYKKWYSQTTYTLLSNVNTWMKESYNKKTLTTHYKLFIATNFYRILDFKRELLENKNLFGNSSQPKRIKNNKIRNLTFFSQKHGSLWMSFKTLKLLSILSNLKKKTCIMLNVRFNAIAMPLP